jgi:o-succinylbenzoate---CoA ligase
MNDPLHDTAARFGPRRALVDRGTGLWVSWFTLDDLAQTWAQRLRREGVRPGHRVAVRDVAGVTFAAVLFGCMRAGAAVVPLPPRAPRAEVDRVLADCRPFALIDDGELTPLPEPAAGDEGDVSILYTSGTTGPPKGVRHTLAQHAASARGCRERLGGDEHDRWLLALSPHHVGGLTMFVRSALANQPLVTLPEFDAGRVLEVIEEDRPTLVSLVPTMLERLIDAGGAELLRPMRALLIGGAPATAERVREWAALGLPVCPSYGLTETCSQVAVVPPGRAAELAGTAGMACGHARIEIDPRPGLGPGVGEIVVHGPCVSPGYVNPALSPAPDGDRFRTGDLGRMDGDVLTVLGRADDTIVTGGENVHPEEVEAVLRAHPQVADAAVAARPDREWGERVCAWVVAAEPGLAATALEGWCRERLSAFKVPRRWTFVAEVPRTGGKLRRRLLPD